MKQTPITFLSPIMPTAQLVDKLPFYLEVLNATHHHCHKVPGSDLLYASSKANMRCFQNLKLSTFSDDSLNNSIPGSISSFNPDISFFSHRSASVFTDGKITASLCIVSSARPRGRSPLSAIGGVRHLVDSGYSYLDCNALGTVPG